MGFQCRLIQLVKIPGSCRNPVGESKEAGWWSLLTTLTGHSPPSGSIFAWVDLNAPTVARLKARPTFRVPAWIGLEIQNAVLIGLARVGWVLLALRLGWLALAIMPSQG